MFMTIVRTHKCLFKRSNRVKTFLRHAQRQEECFKTSYIKIMILFTGVFYFEVKGLRVVYQLMAHLKFSPNEF